MPKEDLIIEPLILTIENYLIEIVFEQKELELNLEKNYFILFQANYKNGKNKNVYKEEYISLKKYFMYY